MRKSTKIKSQAWRRALVIYRRFLVNGELVEIGNVYDWLSAASAALRVAQISGVLMLHYKHGGRNDNEPIVATLEIGTPERLVDVVRHGDICAAEVIS